MKLEVITEAFPSPDTALINQLINLTKLKKIMWIYKRESSHAYQIFTSEAVALD